MATQQQLGTQHQIRRDTYANISGYTGPQGEWQFDLTSNRVVLHDGATQGGFPTAMAAVQTMTTSTSVQLWAAMVFVNPGGALTVTLPPVANYPIGQVLTIVDAYALSTTNNITVTCSSTQEAIWSQAGTSSTSVVINVAGLAFRALSNGGLAWVGGHFV